jgi:hypothetical protein
MPVRSNGLLDRIHSPNAMMARTNSVVIAIPATEVITMSRARFARVSAMPNARSQNHAAECSGGRSTVRCRQRVIARIHSPVTKAHAITNMVFTIAYVGLTARR